MADGIPLLRHLVTVPFDVVVPAKLLISVATSSMVRTVDLRKEEMPARKAALVRPAWSAALAVFFILVFSRSNLALIAALSGSASPSKLFRTWKIREKSVAGLAPRHLSSGFFSSSSAMAASSAFLMYSLKSV